MEHLLPYLARKVLRRLSVRVETESLRDMAAQMALLVVERVLELLRGRCPAYHHDRLAPVEIGIGKTGVHVPRFEVGPRPFQVPSTATKPAQIGQYPLRPVGRHRIIDTHAPVVARKVYVLHYHSIAFQSIGVPLPMQSA